MDKTSLTMDASALMGSPTGTVVTPSGLHVPQHSFETLVKAEARKLAKETNNFPQLFSKMWLASNMIAHGAREKPVGTPSFKTLYLAAENSFIDRILIQARADQNKQIWQRALFGKQVGFKVVHDRHSDPEFEETDEIRRRCREMEELLADPTPEKFRPLYPNGMRIHGGLKDFITRMVRAELIIDRKVMYRYPRRDGRGYAAFHWIPGETLRPVHEGLKEWAEKHEVGKRVTERTMENVWRKTGLDLYDKDYCQLVDGEIVAAFTDKEISLHIANPSDRIDRHGYGESRLEISLDVTATLMMAWKYNRELFNTNYPEHLLTVSGDYNKEGFEAFKQMIMAETGGPVNHRLPMIPSGDESFKVEAHKLRDTPKDMLFDQFFRMMVNLKCASYGAHPSIMNFTMESGGGSGSPMFGHGSAETEIEFSKEHGFKPALLDQCEWLTDALVKPSYQDLRVILEGLDEEDEKERLELMTTRGKSHKSRNELRIMEGDEPVGDPDDPDNPWNYPSDAPLSTYITTMVTKKQMEAGESGLGDEFEEEPEAGADELLHDEQGIVEEPKGDMFKSDRGGDLYLEITIDD